MDPWVGKTPWTRKWQPTPGFLPGKFHEQRSLAGYHSQARKKSDMTEPLSTNTHPSLTGSMCGWGSPRLQAKAKGPAQGQGDSLLRGGHVTPAPSNQRELPRGLSLLKEVRKIFILPPSEPWELLSTRVLPWIRIKTEVTLRDVNIETDPDHFVGALYKAVPEHSAPQMCRPRVSLPLLIGLYFPPGA